MIALGRLGPRNLLELGRLVIQGGSAIADRFASEEAEAFLVAPGMHPDLQPEVPGSGAYALIMHLLGERVGMPVAEGGSGAVMGWAPSRSTGRWTAAAVACRRAGVVHVGDSVHAMSKAVWEAFYGLLLASQP